MPTLDQAITGWMIWACENSIKLQKLTSFSHDLAYQVLTFVRKNDFRKTMDKTYSI
jgi:hypothetical protein